MEEPPIPPQKIYVLNLEEVNQEEVLLSTVEGTEVRVPVVWKAHGLRLYGGAVDKEFILRNHDPERIMHDGAIMTMKHLGVAARRGLGLPGKTPLGVSVRVLSGIKVLGTHQPLATLMDAQSSEYIWANENCHCCQLGLQGPAWPPGVHQEPFANCYFCEDSPSWHHGWCCPHNPESDFYRGLSHRRRYQEYVRRARRNRWFYGIRVEP